MGEGVSATEVGHEISEHRHHAEEEGPAARQEVSRQDRRLTVLEAVLLSAVTILAAWSGFASAKWGTDAQLTLARAGAARTEANRANMDALETRNFDSSTFNTWFTAYVAHDQQAMDVAAHRFRPEFRVAFDAWMATDPGTNPDAPPGPTFMPQYRQPELARATALDAKATRLYDEGAHAGATADEYVRTTVLLASVLFLVGISGHFRVRAARYGLIGLGAVILTISVAIIATSPGPPG